jgi:hypothetical protein
MKEPGQKLLAEMGWDYYNTEFAARRVAEFAEKKMERFAQNIVENLTLATWSSKYGLSPVELTAKELIEKFKD